ncbi:MAG: MotA/TolQ/ExbB proton channel family protein [Acidobacteriota bacterium]
MQMYMKMFGDMGAVAWVVLAILFIMSIYSISIMFDKYKTFKAARTESVAYLPILVKALRENKLDDAINQSRKFSKSHIAKVVSAGLVEFQNQKADGTAFDLVGAVERQLEMAGAMTTAEMKKGLGALATIGSTAPFIGLFGTVMGILAAFQGIATSGSGGLASVAGGISEALFTTAAGLLVAIPALMAFNYFTGSLERFQIEMTNSAREVVDFFLKRHGAGYGAK